jgi:hypothetical protein
MHESWPKSAARFQRTGVWWREDEMDNVFVKRLVECSSVFSLAAATIANGALRFSTELACLGHRAQVSLEKSTTNNASLAAS